MRPLRLPLLALLPLVVLPACGGDSRGRTMIQNKGSDTLVNVAQAWAEGYRKANPDAIVAVTGGGTGTGFSALINGTVDIANASREMKADEIEAARRRGVDPRRFLVGYDALAVFVHEDNPVPSFTLDQLAAIYGEGGDTTRWSQLGVDVPGCDGDEIIRVSRQNNSGTYEYFKEAVLGAARDFKMGSRDMHGSKDVADLVAHTPCAIGYSGLAYATAGVRLVPIAAGDGSAPIPPTVATAVDGTYPIARPLLMYVDGEPTGAVKDYLDWILGPEGQALLAEKGYAPVTDAR